MRVLRSACRRCARLSSDRDGTSVLEFAIVGPAFIALILAIIYTILVFVAQQMLESAAQDAGRLLLIGSAQTIKLANGDTGTTAGDFKKAIC